MDEDTTELIERVIASYLDQLDDPGEVDAQDLAENIASRLEKK
jgi:hypothetical protein